MREFTPDHLRALSVSQQNRKLNKNNKTGYKGISIQGTAYKVEVGGTYIGRRKNLKDAIVIRDLAVAKMFEYKIQH